ncbi:MAG: hypothetical protein DRQ51_04980 [Gammaproteobacteria bacterium]|nr:MAG: hypothetical protein DRQ51_04980 [Gammaproteobacteria bacterium]
MNFNIFIKYIIKYIIIYHFWRNNYECSCSRNLQYKIESALVAIKWMTGLVIVIQIIPTIRSIF